LQGRNKVGAYSLISLAVRAIALIPIFLFVNKPSDVWIAAGIQSLSAVFVSVLSLVFVLSLREVQKVKISINETVRHLRESLPLFLSSAAVNLYTSSNTVILGAVSGPQEVGYFAAADRVRSAVQGLVGAVQQAIYPVAAKLFSQSLRRALLFIGNAMRYMFSLTMILGLLLALSAGFIIETLAGEGFSGARIPFCVLAFTPAVGVLNNFLGVQIIIPLGYRKYFSSVLIMVGAINVAVCAFVSSRLGASGAAVAALNAEVMILIAFLFKLKMSGISVNISGRIKEASYHE
jgi:PST family polysaccharide transporter